LNIHDCDAIATCIDTDGAFECSCPDGYTKINGVCEDIDECMAADLNNCNFDSGASCNNTIGDYFCNCPDGLGGAGTIDSPCTEILGNCPNFAVEGYVTVGNCDTVENSFCAAKCDTGADFFATADGKDVNFEFKCACNGDDCDYRLVGSAPVDGAQCVSCPAMTRVTWFNGATNKLRVQGPNGALVKSRVQPNLELTNNWDNYTVLLMLPGDYSKTRIFSWIYDIDMTILESDGSSTLVVLSQNQNSPDLLKNKWSRFFVGFDKIPDSVSDVTDFRMGVMPGSVSSSGSDQAESLKCLLESLPVQPSESESRKVLREIRQEKLENLENLESGNARNRRDSLEINFGENIVEQAINYIFS
jgi:hypothetical protein